jgi:hypothetical protein
MPLVTDYLILLINQGTKILMMTPIRSLLVPLEMISKVVPVKVTLQNVEKSDLQVDLSQRSKMNGNKETLRRDMKKEMISL